MLRYIELTVCNIIFVTFDISWSNGRMKRFTTNDLIALTFSHHYHGCIYFNCQYSLHCRDVFLGNTDYSEWYNLQRSHYLGSVLGNHSVWSAAKNRPQNQHFPANAERIVTGPLFKMSYNDTVCIDFQIMFIKLDPWADFNFPDGSQFCQFVESGTRWAFVTWQMNENNLFVAPKHFLLFWFDPGEPGVLF